MFCSVFHEVMRLQSFESGVADIIPANVQNISPLVFLLYFRQNYEERTFSRSYKILND